MIKGIIKLHFILILLCGCLNINAQFRFNISGELPVIYDGLEIKINYDNTLLTTHSKDGKFELTGIIKNPIEKVNFTLKQNEKVIEWFSLFIKQGHMQLEILKLDERNPKKYMIFRNFPFIAQQISYDSINKIFNDSLSLLIKLKPSIKSTSYSDFDNNSWEIIYRNLKRKRLVKRIDYFKSNINSYFGLYILRDDIIGDPSTDLEINSDSLLILYDTLNDNLKLTTIGTSILAALNKKNALSLNKILSTFSFNSNEGKLYEIANFRDKKNVLLCFWASWCGPCIKSLPTIKKLATEYANNDLEIISISIDKYESDWLKALEKLKIPWIQTCDIEKYNNGISIEELYDIKYIPQYFLINKEGRLIYHSTQSKDDDEYSVLKKTLKKLFNN